MAYTTAFFTTFVSNDDTLDLTVVDANGVVVDISTATEITWKMATSETAAATMISKSKTGGTITFITDGTDGQIRVDTTTANWDTAGTFYQQCVVTMPNNTVNVSIGTVWVRASI